jgi:Zinc finger, C2H2 type
MIPAAGSRTPSSLPPRDARAPRGAARAARRAYKTARTTFGPPRRDLAFPPPASPPLFPPPSAHALLLTRSNHRADHRPPAPVAYLLPSASYLLPAAAPRTRRHPGTAMSSESPAPATPASLQPALDTSLYGALSYFGAGAPASPSLSLPYSDSTIPYSPDVGDPDEDLPKTQRSVAGGGGGGGSFVCPIIGCRKSFQRRYNLAVHMRRHTGETPYTCLVSGCGKKFKWRSSMAHHNKSHERAGHISARLPIIQDKNLKAMSKRHLSVHVPALLLAAKKYAQAKAQKEAQKKAQRQSEAAAAAAASAAAAAAGSSQETQTVSEEGEVEAEVVREDNEDHDICAITAAVGRMQRTKFDEALSGTPAKTRKRTRKSRVAKKAPDVHMLPVKPKSEEFPAAMAAATEAAAAAAAESTASSGAALHPPTSPRGGVCQSENMMTFSPKTTALALSVHGGGSHQEVGGGGGGGGGVVAVSPPPFILPSHQFQDFPLPTIAATLASQEASSNFLGNAPPSQHNGGSPSGVALHENEPGLEPFPTLTQPYDMHGLWISSDFDAAF